MKRVLLSWSSGKDSAWALHLLRHDPQVEVCALLTTTNEAVGRVAMHAVRNDLLAAQARAANVPLITVPLPWPCSNAEYEGRMAAVMDDAAVQGLTHVAFGDLFLDEVRRYREDRLANTGLEPMFPLWGKPTTALAREMVAAGLRARVTCIDPRVMDRGFAGREFDAEFLTALPPSIDPCGERGEFHTFAYAGPMFRHTVRCVAGEIVERDGFVFADLLRES